MIFGVDIAPYKALFDERRWDNLIAEFRQENYRLFQLANQSVFTVALQAGLSALKTPYPFVVFLLDEKFPGYGMLFLLLLLNFTFSEHILH